MLPWATGSYSSYMVVLIDDRTKIENLLLFHTQQNHTIKDSS
jgi:hypothetical protein